MSVTLNPVAAAGVRVPSVTRSERASSLNRIIINSASLTVKTATETKQAFQRRPLHATATALSYFSLALHIISTFTDWYRHESNYANPNIKGQFTLTDWSTCVIIEDPQPIENSKECRLVPLGRIASVLSFFYTAGSISLAFLIFGIPWALAAAYVTNLRRKNALENLPESAFKGKVSLLWLRTLPGIIILQGVTVFHLAIAFISYAAIVNTGWDDTKMFLVSGVPITSHGFGGGFGISVAAIFLSIGALLIVVLKRGEVVRALPGSEYAGGVAMQDGFDSVTAVRPVSDMSSAYGGGLPPAYPPTAYQPDTYNLVDPGNIRNSGPGMASPSGDMTDVRV